MRVQEFMTSKPVNIPTNATLPAAAELINCGGVKGLSVVENGHVVGIITDRDTKQSMPSAATSLSIWEINCLLTEIKVSEIMSQPIYSLSEGAGLGYAAEQLLGDEIGEMPLKFGN